MEPLYQWSELIMRWRVRAGQPGVPLPLSHYDHWLLVDMIIDELARQEREKEDETCS